MASTFDSVDFLNALLQQKRRPPTEIPGVNVPDVDPFALMGPVPLGGRGMPTNPIPAAVNPPSPYLMANPPPVQQAPPQDPTTAAQPAQVQPVVNARPTRDQFFGKIPAYSPPPNYTPPVRNVASEQRQNLSGLAGSILGSILTGGRTAAQSASGYLTGARGTQDDAYNAQLAKAQADYANSVNATNSTNQNITRQMGQAESQYDDATHNYEYDQSEKDRKDRDAAAAAAAAQKSADALAEQTAKQTAQTKQQAQAAYVRRRQDQVNKLTAVINKPGVALADKQKAVATINRINSDTGLGVQDMPIPADLTPAEMLAQLDRDRSYGLQVHNSNRADNEFAQRTTQRGVLTPNEINTSDRQLSAQIAGHRARQAKIQNDIDSLYNMQVSGSVAGIGKILGTGLSDTIQDPNNKMRSIPRPLDSTLRPMINAKMVSLTQEKEDLERRAVQAEARRQAILKGASNQYGTQGIDKRPGVPAPTPAPRPTPNPKPVTIDPAKLKGMSDTDLFRIMATGK